MTLESAISFFVAVFVFGITPGPGIFAILARGLVSGARSCVGLALGMVMSDILYLIAACFGLATIAHHWGELFTVIRIVGAAYLIYLGWKMWTAPIVIPSEQSDHKNRSGLSSFIQGFLISASNPKVILFYVAFLPTFLDVTALDGFDIVLVSVLTFVALMVGVMLIAVFAARARLWFQSREAVKRLNRGAGSIMMGAGAYLASRG